jgi:hypothetical protein
MTTWTEGIDAAWGRPTPAELVAAGKHFIVGYVSHDPAKNLTKAECHAYLDAGIAVGLVWETTTSRALSGADGGHVDGIEARRQARLLGFPDDKPIGFAVDFPATATQLSGPIRAYGVAFRAQTGTSGVYGGKATIRYFVNNRLADTFWQTYAWSTTGTSVAKMQADPYDFGWVPEAQVQQYHNGVSISGHDTDLDRAIDLSAFWTKENTEMTAPTAAQNQEAVWHTAGSTGNPTRSAGSELAIASRDATASSEKADQILAKLDSIAVGGIDMDAMRKLVSEEVAKVINSTNTSFTLNYTDGAPTTSTS